jgi:hypothetical protein
MVTVTAPIELETILAELNGLDKERLAAIQKLAQLDLRSQKALVALEQVFLNDPSPEVRQAALKVLTLPQHQRAYRAFSCLNKKARALMPAEIDRWVEDCLVTPRQALLLKARLGFGEVTESTQ